MPVERLTDVAIRNKKKPREFLDTGYRGLALRVSEFGTKSWVSYGRLKGRLGQ